jgi:hypothetical protein
MQTIDPTSETIAQAQANLERISSRMLHLLSFVPDDKLSWAPSPTSKSALRIAAHAALVSQRFAALITESMPDPMPNPEEFFKGFLDEELTFTTRESVVNLTNEATAKLSQALGTVTTECIDSSPNSPFGPVPKRFWIGLTHDHLAGHVGQMEYLQTIWGDLDNHM